MCVSGFHTRSPGSHQTSAEGAVLPRRARLLTGLDRTKHLGAKAGKERNAIEERRGNNGGAAEGTIDAPVRTCGGDEPGQWTRRPQSRNTLAAAKPAVMEQTVLFPPVENTGERQAGSTLNFCTPGQHRKVWRHLSFSSFNLQLLLEKRRPHRFG